MISFYLVRMLLDAAGNSDNAGIFATLLIAAASVLATLLQNYNQSIKLKKHRDEMKAEAAATAQTTRETSDDFILSVANQVRGVLQRNEELLTQVSDARKTEAAATERALALTESVTTIQQNLDAATKAIEVERSLMADLKSKSEADAKKSVAESVRQQTQITRLSDDQAALSGINEQLRTERGLLARVNETLEKENRELLSRMASASAAEAEYGGRIAALSQSAARIPELEAEIVRIKALLVGQGINPDKQEGDKHG